MMGQSVVKNYTNNSINYQQRHRSEYFLKPTAVRLTGVLSMKRSTMRFTLS